ncbi:MAG: anti-sigma factor domain-containing protein [Bacilli bacterium]
MNRGIVMEFADERTAVVLTSEVGFVKVRRREGMAVGEEIELPPSLLQPGGLNRRSFATRRRPFYMTAGALVATLVAATVISLSRAVPAAAAPYVYVSVDINPSVEFTVDKAQRVVAVTSLDAAGAQAVGRVHMVGEPIGNAIQIYLHELLNLGMVKSHASVIVTSAAQNSAPQSTLTGVIQRVDKEVRATLGRADYHLVSFSVQKRVYKTALDYHVTPGRLALYIEAKRAGWPVSWADIVDGHLAKALGGQKQLTAMLDQLQHDTSLDAALQAVAEEESKTESKSESKTKTAKTIATTSQTTVPQTTVPQTTVKANHADHGDHGERKSQTPETQRTKQADSTTAAQATPLAPTLPANLPPLPPLLNSTPSDGVSVGPVSIGAGESEQQHRTGQNGDNGPSAKKIHARDHSRSAASAADGSTVAHAAHDRKGYDHKSRGHGHSDHSSQSKDQGGGATHKSQQHQNEGEGSGISITTRIGIATPSTPTQTPPRAGTDVGAQGGNRSSTDRGNGSAKSSKSVKSSKDAKSSKDGTSNSHSQRDGHHQHSSTNNQKHGRQHKGQQGIVGGIGVSVGLGTGSQSDGAPQDGAGSSSGGSSGNGSADGSGGSGAGIGVSVGIGSSSGQSGQGGSSGHHTHHHHHHSRHHERKHHHKQDGGQN